MSGNIDWTLIVMASQKAQSAAEASLASARLLDFMIFGSTQPLYQTGPRQPDSARDA
jgi:hypothetical protein